MNFKQAAQALAVGASSVLLTLLLAEAVLRLIDIPTTSAAGWKWDESPYRSPANASDSRVNQLGLRGAPIEYSDGDFVVLLLGDSQVEAGTQPAGKMPEALLRESLQRRMGRANVKVFSVASAGWGTDQQLVWLQRYFASYRADLVVNWFTPVNDYWENAFVDRSVTSLAGRLKPTYRLAAGGDVALAEVGSRWRLRTLLAVALGRALHGKAYTLEQRYLDEWQSALPSPHVAPQPGDCPSVEIHQDGLIGSYMAGSRAYTMKTDEALQLGRSHFSVFLLTSSARDRYSIDVTHRLLAKASRTSGEHGANFLIFHAYRHDLDAAVREIRCVKTPDGNTYAFDGSDWLRHLKASPLAGQLITGQVSAEHALSSGPNDWHFSEEGNRKSMALLADLIAARSNPALMNAR